MDNWGAIVGSYSFRAGFGIYLFNKYEETEYLILTLLLIFLISLDIKNFFYQINGHKITNYLKNITKSLFDDRSRSIDFICLLILIDTYKFELIFVKYIFFIMIIRQILKFTNSFYLIYFKEFLKQFK